MMRRNDQMNGINVFRIFYSKIWSLSRGDKSSLYSVYSLHGRYYFQPIESFRHKIWWEGKFVKEIISEQ